MPNPRLIQIGLIGLSYLLLLGVLATGALQLVQKGSAALKTAHRWAAVLTLAFYTMAQTVIILLPNGAVYHLFTFLLFVLMTFGAAFSGWESKPGARKAIHLVMGAATFLMFTFFIFRFLLAAA
jgi:hypothetical protein